LTGGHTLNARLVSFSGCSYLLVDGKILHFSGEVFGKQG